jgi:hypothetical protein
LDYIILWIKKASLALYIARYVPDPKMDENFYIKSSEGG